MKRRNALGALALPWLADPGRTQTAVRPAWLGFGLNGGEEASRRFPLTLGAVRRRGAGGTDFQLEVARAIRSQIESTGVAEVRNEVQIGESLMLGAALDYENVLAARLGSSSFLVLHLVGHGVLLGFDWGRGWKLISSFPFPVILLREAAGDVAGDASKYLAEAFTAPEKSFASAFTKAAVRLAPRWKESGRGFNVRVLGSAIHPAAQAKLASWGVERNVTEPWLGHLASAAICETLQVPVVPFAETQALGRFSYMFAERLVAQNVRLPDDGDIDLRLHVTLRNVGRDIRFRSQLQRWEAVRQVVLEVRALDDRDEEIVSLRAGYQDDVADALARQEDNSPARDAHFLDMAIYRCLQTLFNGIARNDEAELAKVFVKPDAQQRQRIERFRSKYQQAI